MRTLIEHRRLRDTSRAGLGLWALVCLFQPLASRAEEPRRIEFPYVHASDLRGILNIFHAFKRACLEQPVSEGLAERILPADYRIVSIGTYVLGNPSAPMTGTRFLSRTGDEEKDRAGGYPLIQLTLPSDKTPDGRCQVTWNRKWDYPPDDLPRIMLSMAGTLNAQISYRLEAILTSVPEDSFLAGENYGVFGEWVTWCWEDQPCAFTVNFVLDKDDGIYMTVTRNTWSLGQTPQ
ncbi:hypothetical protein FMN50_27280 [Rhodobacterales bacterium]|nr:hypothetical protein FMN50_27280 [Rhodobacterales bacterium]